jgi:hypothetical protein
MVGMGNNPPVLGYADRNAGRWVPITQYRSELLVHMAASKLEAEGIRVFIEDHPRRAGAVRPARINVLADEVPAAVSILMQTPARDYLLEPPDKMPTLEYARPERRPRRVSAWLFIAGVASVPVVFFLFDLGIVGGHGDLILLGATVALVVAIPIVLHVALMLIEKGR